MVDAYVAYVRIAFNNTCLTYIYKKIDIDYGGTWQMRDHIYPSNYNKAMNNYLDPVDTKVLHGKILNSVSHFRSSFSP